MLPTPVEYGHRRCHRKKCECKPKERCEAPERKCCVQGELYHPTSLTLLNATTSNFASIFLLRVEGVAQLTVQPLTVVVAAPVDSIAVEFTAPTCFVMNPGEQAAVLGTGFGTALPPLFAAGVNILDENRLVVTFAAAGEPVPPGTYVLNFTVHVAQLEPCFVPCAPQCCD